MKITLKDGSSKEYAQSMSVIDIAKDISEGLARVATAGEVDGEVVDLRTVIDKDCELNILTAKDEKVWLFFAIQHLMYLHRQYRICIRRQRLPSDHPLTQDSIMISIFQELSQKRILKQSLSI